MNNKFLSTLKFLSIAGLLLLVNVAFSQSADFPLYVNAGSSTSYISADEDIFVADRDWVAGSWGFIGGIQKDIVGAELYATGGTEIKPVFSTQRQGWTEFRASNIANDTYLVTLYFREEKAHGPKINQVRLVSEGVILEDNLDIYAHVGRDHALTYRFATTVNDGELNIQAEVLEGVTNISALEIQKSKDTGSPPSVPKNLIGQDSYDAAQIYWSPVSSGDLHGYWIYRSADSGPFERVNDKPVLINRYQDRSAQLGTAYQYKVTSVDAFGIESEQTAPVTAQRLDVAQSTLPVLDLTLEPIDWEFLYAFPFDQNSVTGQLTVDGQTYEVEARYRGKGSRGSNKKNWKIKFSGNSPFEDKDTLNLNADNMDFSYLRGPLSFGLLDSMGVSAPQHGFALLFVNGIYMGVYNNYEQIDEHFMARTGRDDDTIIYKGQINMFKDLNSDADYELAYEKNNKRTSGHAEIIDLIEGLSNASEDQFPWMLQDKLDIESYLKMYAFNVWVGHIDSFDGNSYIIYDAKRDYWEVIPWDYDFAFGTYPSDFGFYTSHGIDLGMGAERVLPRRGVNVPQYRQYFCQQLESLSSTTLSQSNVSAEVSGLLNQILPDAQRDWLKIGWQDSSQLYTLPADFGQYVAERNAIIAAQMPAYCDSYDRPYLKINEVVPQNLGQFCDAADGQAGCDDDWIEIYNSGLVPVDLNGMYLSDESGNPTKHKITGPLVVPPLGHLTLWADGQLGQGAAHLNFTLNDRDGAIYLSDTSGALLDTLSWSGLASGNARVRIPDGTNTLQTVTAATQNKPNTQAAPDIIDVDLSPIGMAETDSVFIQAEIVDEGEFEPVMHYQIDGTGFVSIPMFNGSGANWLAVIGPRPNGTRVQYYVTATDEDGLTRTEPANAPQKVYEYVVGYESPTLFINELMASNDGVYFDPDEEGETPDYIEIYNPGPWAVNLADMYATDTLTKTTDYRLAKQTGQLVVPAGEHLLLIADDDGKQGSNHLGFKLSKGGEAFGLFDRKGFGNQLIDGIEFDEQTTNVAIGRCEDGGAWGELEFHSPGRSNESCGRKAPTLSNMIQTPRYPVASNNSPVKIDVTAEDDKGIQSVWLHYRLPNEPWVSNQMSRSGSTYSSQIPSILQRGVIVEYYVEAIDNQGISSHYPLGAPTRLNRFMYHTTQPETYPEFAAPPNLKITELVANPISAGINDPDEAGEKAAWIEIYNGEPEEVDLGGYVLAHALLFPHDYVIPAGVTIPAQSYITFLLDDDPEQGVMHAAFEPIHSGDTIGLYTPHQILIDEVTYGSELEDGAVLSLDGPDWVVNSCATPGAENSAECQTVIFLPIGRR